MLVLSQPRNSARQKRRGSSDLLFAGVVNLQDGTAVSSGEMRCAIGATGGLRVHMLLTV